MTLMTLPPTVEVREDYKRSDYASPSGFVFWAMRSGTTPSFGSWKSDVFARIAKLERGPSVPGLGNLRVSEQAAGQLRLQLADVSIHSLPYPSLVPISGQGAHMDWRSGTRTVELTAFADGELVFEATEAGNTVELQGSDRLDSYLKWLLGLPQMTPQYAPAR
jgi:hypothetical protein